MSEATTLTSAPPVAEPEPQPSGEPHRRTVWLAAAAIFALAFVARLIPMLPAGGLYGLGNYDDGVNYAAAAVFVEGFWPYRDFLLLHPPGIVVALAPFALIGSLFGDPTGMLIGRLTWMALGGLNALLVAKLLLPMGGRAALLGGVVYAVFFPAIYGEHTVLLEPPGTAALLISLLLIRSTAGRVPTPARLAVAGAILGATASIKIWGIVPVLVIVGWLAFTHSRKGALAYLGGAAAGCAAVCLPFFLAAPSQMWTMVVTSQLGRPRGNATILERMIDIGGLSMWGNASLTPLIAAGLLAGGICFVFAALDRRSRLYALLLVVLVGLLLATPAWFLHYSALSAAPAALVAGAGADRAIALVERLAGGRRAVGVALTVLALLVLAGYTAKLPDRHMSRVFPGPQLGAALATLPGCVATDDPSTLIQMDLLRRNIDRGCRVEVDLGGHNYVLPHPGDTRVSRGRNPNFQAFCLDYFRSHQAVITVKFRQGRDYSKATAKIYESWPELVRIGSRVVRVPQP